MRALQLLTLLISLTAFSQTPGAKISLSVTNAPLEVALKAIKKQSGYKFVYTREQLRRSVPVTLVFEAATLAEVLDACFKEQPFTYVIEGKYIALRDRSEPEAELPVERPLRGMVTDEEKNPLAAITVMVKRSGEATATDNRGAFNFKNVRESDLLMVSGVGYQTRQVSVKGQEPIEIALSIAITQMDETLVIAYGTTTKRLNTGSVTKVTSEQISQQPVSNPIATLQGRVPGLVVTQSSGVPGSSFFIQVRGQNTISPNANTLVSPQDNPLFIIDGVPFAPQNNNINLYQSMASPGTNVRYNNAYGGISPFNSINPADIESIEILRDADATAIYGSRGANGVILITTKKGKAGKTKFQMNIATGISHITRSMPLLTTSQYRAMRREAFANDGLTPNLTLFSRGYAPDLLVFDSTRNMDWKDYFFGGNARTTDVNGSVSGGTGTTQFLVGAGYRHDSYIFPGDFGNDRGSVSFSLHNQSDDQRFGLDLSSNYSVAQNNSSRSPSALVAFTLPPNYPDLTDANGNLNWSYRGLDLFDNPLAYTKQPYTLLTRNLISSLQLSYRVLGGLVIRTNFGYNSIANRETSLYPKSSQDPSQFPQANASFGSNDYQTWIAEPRIEYRKTIGRKSITILAGGTIQQNSNTQTTVEGFNYSNDNLLGSISGAANRVVNDAYSQYKYAALFARLNFNLANRYLVNINGRRDGSSRFGPGKQFGNFGSVGLAWLFSEEAFTKAFKALSYGKFRLSYGTTGNDNIGDYQYVPRWTPNLSYGGVPGYIPQNLFNPGFS